jgi:hypothetical protein
MRKILLSNTEKDTIDFDMVQKKDKIFAKKDGELHGMVVLMDEKDGRQWTLALGGNLRSNGYHDSLKDLLKSNLHYGYEFFVA